MVSILRDQAARLLVVIAISCSLRIAGYAQAQKEPSTAGHSPQAAVAEPSCVSVLENVEKFTKPLAEVITMLAACLAAFKYTQAVRTRHAEWLLTLFKSFYETPRYRKMRSLLDSPKSEKFIQFKSDLTQLGDSDDLQSFDRYLNFFEFVAVLWNRGQLTRGEVCDLFEYYLQNLKSSDAITYYIEHQGFERLQQLLKEVAPKPQ